MSELKVTNLSHPSSGSANITLAADGSVVLPAGFTGGVGSNVVQTVKTDSFTTSSTTFTSVTGLSATITPTTATSKILVVMTTQGTSQDAAGNSYSGVRVIRDSTPLTVSTAGSVQQFANQLSGRDLASNDSSFGVSSLFLDSPATTSAVTYQVEAKTGSTSLYINRDESGAVGSISTLTLIEVAA